MLIKLGDSLVYYTVAGQGDPIILLHGWGRSSADFTGLQEWLALRFTVYRLDLPGFGLSTPPGQVWGSVEYAEVVEQFIQRLQLAEPILLGHSFGGKITLHLALRAQGRKIILISSSGIKLPKSLKLSGKIYFTQLLKFGAKLPIIGSVIGGWLERYRQRWGSQDYRQARGVMRKILVKVVGEDVTPLLARIKIPVLLIWGDRDPATPLAAGKILQRELATATLKVLTNCGHFPFLEYPLQVSEIMNHFLDEGR